MKNHLIHSIPYQRKALKYVVLIAIALLCVLALITALNRQKPLIYGNDKPNQRQATTPKTAQKTLQLAEAYPVTGGNKNEPIALANSTKQAEPYQPLHSKPTLFNYFDKSTAPQTQINNIDKDMQRIAASAGLDASEVFVIQFNPEQLSDSQAGSLLEFQLPGQKHSLFAEIHRCELDQRGLSVKGHISELGPGYGFSLVQRGQRLNGYIVTDKSRYDISGIRGRIYMLRHSHHQLPESLAN
ncbi:hypothetical protein [Agaribacterium haliotis]|uniref:hypothetical protein n=1 Tax=Agaribacterium haliotis TaxID=2013869 RepID=UPI000BB56D41|nr:hypothetical protein [Agaribacterium haliotis]